MKNKLFGLLMVLIMPLCMLFTGCNSTITFEDIDYVTIIKGDTYSTYYNVKSVSYSNNGIVTLTLTGNSKIQTSFSNVIVYYKN